MNNTQTISNSKIIAFVVFVFVAIMTSLFIYRLSHPTKATTLAADAGSLFPAPRELNEFKLQASDSAFTQKNLLNHWTLLFFGFTHCASVCPTTLDMMKRVYSELHTTYPNLQVVLVSLDPDRDTPADLASYTHTFNPDFIGVTGSIQELRKLQSQFGVFSARDDASGNNYQLQHTASIMLINPQGQWAGLFRFGLNPQQFTQAFSAAVTRA